MWDRRVLFMLFTVLFTTPHSAHADIEGTTRIRCYDRNTPVDCGQPTRADGVLAGSGIEGSFLEALIDAAQLLNGIYEAVAAIIRAIRFSWPLRAYEITRFETFFALPT